MTGDSSLPRTEGIDCFPTGKSQVLYQGTSLAGDGCCASDDTPLQISVTRRFTGGYDFTGCRKTPVLYQGTTLVVPQMLEKKMGFSPCHSHRYHQHKLTPHSR
jgi:hypothetical protein